MQIVLRRGGAQAAASLPLAVRTGNGAGSGGAAPARRFTGRAPVASRVGRGALCCGTNLALILIDPFRASFLNCSGVRSRRNPGPFLCTCGGGFARGYPRSGGTEPALHVACRADRSRHAEPGSALRASPPPLLRARLGVTPRENPRH